MRRTGWMQGLLSAVAAIGLLASAPAKADPVADFYRGKQITFLVGSDPGGGYDLLARLVARHLGQFIPGNPGVIVENMPGAGSILLSNRVYNTAPKDGTVIGLVQRGVLLSETTGQPGVHYDLSKFNWIGSVNAEVSMVTAWHTAPVNSFADLRTIGMVVGGTGATSDSEASARMLIALTGAKLTVVSGYPGTADVILAMERGELQGIADLSWPELKAKGGKYTDGSLKFLAQNELVKSPDMPNVPLTIEFVQNASDKPVAELFWAIKQVARPILSGPNIPPERVAALRDGFDAMVKDPGFLDDAKAMKLELAPSGHASVEAYLAKTKAASPEVKARLTEILNTKK